MTRRLFEIEPEYSEGGDVDEGLSNQPENTDDDSNNE